MEILEEMSSYLLYQFLIFTTSGKMIGKVKYTKSKKYLTLCLINDTLCLQN